MKHVINFNRLPKQEYMKPQMRTVELRHQSHLLLTSGQQATSTSGPLNYRGSDASFDEEEAR